MGVRGSRPFETFFEKFHINIHTAGKYLSASNKYFKWSQPSILTSSLPTQSSNIFEIMLGSGTIQVQNYDIGRFCISKLRQEPDAQWCWTSDVQWNHWSGPSRVRYRAETRFSAHNVDIVHWYGTVLDYHGNNGCFLIRKSRLETYAPQLLTEIMSTNWEKCYSATLRRPHW